MHRPPGGLLESLANGKILLKNMAVAFLSNYLTGLLNFVGGKNIIVPSERATKSKAKNLCADQGLELMSFDSLTQLDSVQDFLGDIGRQLGHKKKFKWNWFYKEFLRACYTLQ
jgi:hypothetical protein